MQLADAVEVSHLIWPRFLEIRGCLVRADAYEETNFEQWWESTGGDREKIEYVLNHLHLWDLFLEDDLSSEANQVALLKLGETIRMGWIAALQRQLPNRQVVVELLEDGGYGPEVRVRTTGVDGNGTANGMSS